MEDQNQKDIRKIPIQIERALIGSGWWYTNPALGWTKNGIVHYMLWEDAVEGIIMDSQ